VRRRPGAIASIIRSRPETAVADELHELQERVARLEATRPVLFERVTIGPTAVGATPSSLTTVLSTVVDVPSGAASAVVFMTGSYDAAGSGSSLSIRNTIAGQGGATQTFTSTPARTWFNTVVFNIGGGDTFTLTVDVGSVGAWTTGSAFMSANILYFR